VPSEEQSESPLEESSGPALTSEEQSASAPAPSGSSSSEGPLEESSGPPVSRKRARTYLDTTLPPNKHIRFT
jgi:hypothetical protein